MRKVKKLVNASHTDTITSVADGKGVKLPKLDVPTFDGDILHWKQFREQFCVSVHDRSSLTNAEKLAYLQQALKNGSAKSTFEGLSQSGAHYVEAVGCLKTRYDRPRLIHQAHVRLILEAPPLKEGTGRELRRLHDVVIQHLRALKSMDYDPSGPFITSTLELKLDTTTLFEWQRHSQSETGVRIYSRSSICVHKPLRARQRELTRKSRMSPRFPRRLLHQEGLSPPSPLTTSG